MAYHLACVVGARPNFMKMAPILRSLEQYPEIRPTLIHTGQHYDRNLSDVFFEELNIPKPDVHLGIQGGKQNEQTGRMLAAFEEVFESRAVDERFDRVLVVGDVNSTFAAAFVAAKLCIPVAHVEAGLRSRDRTMPEEVNRVVVDEIADMYFVSEQSGLDNLELEGRGDRAIHHVGNVMIDTVINKLPDATSAGTLERLGLDPQGYGLVTFHRPSNVDSQECLQNVIDVLCWAAERMSLVFPLHPRTRNRLVQFDLLQQLEDNDNIRLLDPLGYIDCLALSSRASVVVTDSGGLQEETTALGVPCLTMRENTERPTTVDVGTNTLVGNDRERLTAGLSQVLDGTYKAGQVPPFWEGRAAERIAAVLAAEAGRGGGSRAEGQGSRVELRVES